MERGIGKKEKEREVERDERGVERREMEREG